MAHERVKESIMVIKGEQFKPCVKTGKLIRAYLDVALREDKGSDSISNCEELTHKVKERLYFYENPWTGTNGELSAAIETLRKRGGLPSIEDIKAIYAVQGGKYDVS
jgi:hypothetical protein